MHDGLAPAPLHRFEQAGTYIVTAGTHLKQHIFTTPAALDLLQHTFFETAEKYGWLPQAWAFFPNHYHFVRRPEQMHGRCGGSSQSCTREPLSR